MVEERCCDFGSEVLLTRLQRVETESRCKYYAEKAQWYGEKTQRYARESKVIGELNEGDFEALHRVFMCLELDGRLGTDRDSPMSLKVGSMTCKSFQRGLVSR